MASFTSSFTNILSKFLIASVLLMVFSPTLNAATKFTDITDIKKDEKIEALIKSYQINNPVADAEAAADRENGTIWFIGGCLGTVLTLVLAQVMDPTPPASALLGESDEYVAQYTDTYINEVKSKRTKNAIYGCITGGVLYVGLWALYAAVVTTSYN